MHAALLVTIALIGPASEWSDSPVTRVDLSPWTAASIQSEIATIHERYRHPSQINSEYDVPHLALMHNVIAQTEVLSLSRRVAMRQMLEARLLTLEEQLQRDRNRIDRETEVARNRLERIHTRSAKRTGDKQQAEAIQQSIAGGATELARVQELIDLIHATVDPDSWDINGGRGTIRYFSTLRVLVIRTTGHGHEQIGNTLGVLEQMRR